MEDEIIYFEVNNWMSNLDYPDTPQFTEWVGNIYTYDIDNLRKDTFFDSEYAKKNELVVSIGIIDMSFNFCICAKRSWIEKNCKNLLEEDRRFLAKIYDGEPESNFGIPFLTYCKENFGTHYFEEIDDPNGGIIWKECLD